MGMNIFRILGDVSHTLSKGILIWAIHSNSSAEGVSLITQAFYCLVFISRYLDFFSGFHYSWWNNILKAFYILSSIYIIIIMLRVYARTREREAAWKLGGACLFGSAVLAPFVMMIFKNKKSSGGSQSWGWLELFWTFSIILESVCVLPQLLLLRQTTVPTVIDSFYLVALGSYRGLYILNWIWRELDTNNRKPDAVSVIFGVIQTAFYIDFFWVYYSRQRVKLRHGGLVDSDDLRNGWLLRRVLGHKAVSTANDEEDEESAPALGGNASGRGGISKWGSRGISVSADDAVLEGERSRQNGFADQEEGIVDAHHEGDEDAKMQNPDDLARILGDEDSDDDGVLPSSSTNKQTVKGINNGNEWND